MLLLVIIQIEAREYENERTYRTSEIMYNVEFTLSVMVKKTFPRPISTDVDLSPILSSDGLILFECLSIKKYLRSPGRVNVQRFIPCKTILNRIV